MIFSKKEEENEYSEPITYDIAENVVKLIQIAHEINGFFTIYCKLSVGDFEVTAENFQDIKLLKSTKSEPDRIIISLADAMVRTETTIELSNIYEIQVDVSYKKRGD